VIFLCLPGGPVLAAAGEWVGDSKVAARLIAATDAAGTADAMEAGIEFRLAPGWHIYWRTPGDAGLPPTADWAGAINMSGAEIAWPSPARLIIGGLQNNVYSGPVILPVAVHILHPGQPTLLHARLRYAACAEVCVPYEAELSLSLPAGLAAPGREAAAIAAARTKVPGSLADAGIAVTALCLDQEAGRPQLDVTLRRKAAPFVAPDLFVEGVAAGVPNARLQEGAHVVRFRAALPARTSDLRDVRLTVTDQARAAEFGVGGTPGCSPGAALQGRG
jgi:suppressor for copper-sensitivity B